MQSAVRSNHSSLLPLALWVVFEAMKEKLTSSQERVLELLHDHDRAHDHAISAQTIHAELRNSEKSVGLATVYRSLETLKLQGLIKALTLPNGETVYSVMPADKHHLNCLNCGKSFPIAVLFTISVVNSRKPTVFRFIITRSNFSGFVANVNRKPLNYAYRTCP